MLSTISQCGRQRFLPQQLCHSSSTSQKESQKKTESKGIKETGKEKTENKPELQEFLLSRLTGLFSHMSSAVSILVLRHLNPLKNVHFPGSLGHQDVQGPPSPLSAAKPSHSAFSPYPGLQVYCATQQSLLSLPYTS